MSRDILWRKREKAINIQNGILKVRLIDPLYGLKKDRSGCLCVAINEAVENSFGEQEGMHGGEGITRCLPPNIFSPKCILHTIHFPAKSQHITSGPLIHEKAYSVLKSISAILKL